MRSARRIVESRCETNSTVRSGCAVHHPVENPLLGLGVDRGERVVEYQQARAPQQRPGDSRALLLPAGKGDAALADQRLPAVGKAPHIVGKLRQLPRGLDLGQRRIIRFSFGQGDVGRERLGEKECLLGDEADARRATAAGAAG